MAFKRGFVFTDTDGYTYRFLGSWDRDRLCCVMDTALKHPGPRNDRRNFREVDIEKSLESGNFAEGYLPPNMLPKAKDAYFCPIVKKMFVKLENGTETIINSIVSTCDPKYPKLIASTETHWVELSIAVVKKLNNKEEIL